ncbi:hypothetical protein CcCBS67573_g08730 [Chytriomyces confervae]|uniref:F-box domain-containing protein n=1 Tax=Chytriomyces confervae TaxID=246404 RepID=A0A507EIP3_9FUNG|nr:hypothetical protein CcCBS67573_g08730 [Chytriomyces confervae]
MDNLPFEVLVHIFLQLDPFKIAKYRRVCRSFDNEVEVLCFDMPASFREGFLTNIQEHVLDSCLAGVFSSYNVTTRRAISCLAPFRARALGNIAKLTIVDLIGNHLTGRIPSELGNLVTLKKLSLTHMRLYCAILDTFGNLINLEELDLSEAKLTDSIPASLGNLINLAKLSLQHNELSGTVPDMFGGMTKLQSLALDYNHLEGPIPQSISLCTQLTTTVGVPESRLAPPGLLHVSNDPFQQFDSKTAQSVLVVETTPNVPDDFSVWVRVFGGTRLAFQALLLYAKATTFSTTLNTPALSSFGFSSGSKDSLNIFNVVKSLSTSSIAFRVWSDAADLSLFRPQSQGCSGDYVLLLDFDS